MIFVPEPFAEDLTPFKTVMVVLVNALLLIWLLTPFFTASHRAIHDLVADSVVVRDGQADVAPRTVTGD